MKADFETATDPIALFADWLSEAEDSEPGDPQRDGFGDGRC